MGEFELLAKVRERLPPANARIRLGSGDDAAVAVPGGATATSVDAVVEGVHFRRGRATLAQIGHKALATALSDLAAMGAEPGEAYVVLGVPSDLGEEGALELLDGMATLAEKTGTSLAGGDLTRSSQLFLAITVVGHAPESSAFVTRGGARPGDVLVVTGELGGAAAGYQLLTAARCIEHTGVCSMHRAARFRARQLEPWPRVGAGRALAAAGATAMIDLSDGLGADARHLAESSSVALRIDAEALPIAAGVQEIAAAAGWDPLQLATSGGEDYELLASIPRKRLAAAQRSVREADAGLALTEIGEVLAGDGVEIRLPDGRLLEPGGFDQLA
ncbi:MAG TPA: thiamine-phosphate kinase [Solirubrobacterales bacterium]|nr:thiamine-phosphate kinase [Solirubrobacterales bacterium]